MSSHVLREDKFISLEIPF